MKAVFYFLICLLPLTAQEQASIRNAQVTLPYTEIRELIDRAHELRMPVEPEVPPVPSLITEAGYTIRELPEGGAKGRVVFEVQSLSKAWQTLDLLDGRLTVTKVEPSTAILMTKGDWLALAINAEGAMKVTVDFLLSGRAGEGFRFKVAEATTSFLVLEGEGEPTLSVSGGQVDPENPRRYHLPSVGCEVLAMRARVRDETARSRVTAWEAMTESLVTSGPDVLRVQTRLQLLTSEAEPGSVARVRLPRLATIQKVASADLESYESRASGDAGFQLLEVVWKSDGVANRLIEVTYEIPRPLNQGVWSLKLPSLVEPLQTRGIVLIAPPEELNLAVPEEVVFNQRTPSWMEDGVAGASTFGVEMSGEQEISLAASPKERLQVARLTIKSASYETQVVKGGDLLTHGELEIEHEKSVSWSFTLPKGATLLACKLDGSSVSPILRADGLLELPLRNPTGGSKVTLSFTAQTLAFDPVEGSAVLSLLKTETFCHAQSWAIALPPEYEATAIEGNIPFNPTPPKDQRLHLLKQLSRGETPSAQIYYRKKSLDQ